MKRLDFGGELAHANYVTLHRIVSINDNTLLYK